MGNYKEIIDKIPFTPVYNPKVYNPAYSNDKIRELEQKLGRALPDDLKYVLLTYGSSTINDLGYSYQDGDAIVVIEIKYFYAEYDIISQWEDAIRQLPKDIFKGDPRLYLPILKAEGYQYLLNLNDESYGSIHAIRDLYKNIYVDASKEQFNDIYIAPTLTAFLQQWEPIWPLRERANDLQKTLFNHYCEIYEAKLENQPSFAESPRTLMELAFNDRDHFKIDGVGSLMTRSNFFRNYKEFETAALWYRDEALNCLFSPLPKLDRKNCDYMGTKRSHGEFRILSLKSTIEPDLLLQETFLLRRHKLAKASSKDTLIKWTFIRRDESTIADLKIKGLGTLSFNLDYKWSLKRRTKPLWSPLAIKLSILVKEDGLRSDLLDIAKEVMQHQSLKEHFESYIYNLYQKEIYPEFLAYDQDDQRDWARNYPSISEASLIWDLLIKEIHVFITDKGNIKLEIETIWDDEHPLILSLTGDQFNQVNGIDDIP